MILLTSDDVPNCSLVQFGMDYGGTLQNANVLQPELVQEHLYRFEVEEEFEFLNSPHLQAITVRAQTAKLVLISKIETPGTIVSFCMTTNQHFGLAMFYSELADDEDIDKMEMVYPQFNQVPVTLLPYKERIICKKPGYYCLWLSNKNAWFRNLKVHLLTECTVHGLIPTNKDDYASACPKFLN